MFSWLIVSCVLGVALADSQDYKLCYEISNSANSSCMSVDVDHVTMTVHYHMAPSGDFGGVETLEDYNVGLAASRVESQEACYVRQLVKSFDDQVAFIKSHQGESMEVKSDAEVSAVPLENPEDEIGTEFANFCGDLPVYKLVKEEEETESVQDRRQVSVAFTTCFLLCFVPRCIVTTLTLPTGNTIIYGWFFG